MVKDEDGFHQVGDAVGAAAELPQEPPAFEGDHFLLAQAAGGFDARSGDI
ncbi:hypothetical protein [Streptomyces atroolivaceus]